MNDDVGRPDPSALAQTHTTLGGPDCTVFAFGLTRAETAVGWFPTMAVSVADMAVIVPYTAVGMGNVGNGNGVLVGGGVLVGPGVLVGGTDVLLGVVTAVGGTGVLVGTGVNVGDTGVTWGMTIVGTGVSVRVDTGDGGRELREVAVGIAGTKVMIA